MRICLLTTIWVITFHAACSSESNVADCETGVGQVPCSEQTPDEKARLALEEKDYDTAITLLEGLIEDDPETYQRYALLAAAYAAASGLDIIKASQASSEEENLTDQMDRFLPDPDALSADAYKIALTRMNQAVQILYEIPATLRESGADTPYAESAFLQLTLYQTAYSFMYLRQFTKRTETGELDLEILESMTAEDAAVVLNNLRQVAELQGTDTEGVGAKIDDALASIDGESGESNKQKLVEWTKKQEED